MRLAAFLPLLVATAAFADPKADARAISDAFAKAVAAGDADAVIALYADDAHVIWLGRGQEATGKVAIAELVRRELPELRKTELTPVSLDAQQLADGVIAVVGRWKQGATEIRTSEVLVRRDGAWKYLVDHASVGAAPPRGRRGPRRR